MGGEATIGNTARVDVLTLEDFQATLQARLDEAHAVQTAMVQMLRRAAPELGTLPDAGHVCGRYETLYDQHLNRVTLLVRSLEATQEALTAIMNNYETTEARLTANAQAIGDALGGVSGARDGTYAG